MASFRKKSLLDQAAGYVESARDQVETAVEHARDSFGDLVEASKPVIADARDKAGPALAEARAKAGPALADARDKAVPLINDAISDARAKAGPVLADARDRATPIIDQAIKDARKVAKPYLEDAQSRAGETAAAARVFADAKVARLKGEPVPQKGSTLKKVALFGVVAAVVGLVAKKLQGGTSNDNWQTSYTQPPAPAAPTPVTVVHDTAGSTPDEALADATDLPHVVTTPDDPADVLDLPVDGASPEDKPSS